MHLDWKMIVLATLLVPGCRDNPSADEPDGDGTDSDATADASAGSDSASDDGDTDTEPEQPQAELEYLTPVEHLVRVSMALRGTRPSAEDLERVQDDPETLPELVDAYMQGPDFGETLREIHNDGMLVDFEVGFPQLPPVEDEGSLAMGRSVVQGPLRLIEYVITNDLPYTEIVTADYAVMDEITATLQGMPYDPGGPELQVITWEDRPAAGVLSDPALFIRHRSTGANYNRGRANAISRALLCHDFLAADVEIDGNIDLSDPDAVNDAVTSNPACVSCHQSLDPLGSFLFVYPGNLNPAQIESYPVTSLYNPSGANAWQFTNERPPAYFGEPAEGLSDLGGLIADDPRFSLCAAKRFYSYFHQLPLDDVPLEAAAELQDTLVDSGFDAKALVREIVLDDEFRVASATTEEAAAELIGLKKARPSQLARLMDDLTGYRWQTNLDGIVPSFQEGDVDLVRTNQLGFAVLAGGTDSFFVEEPTYTVNTTTSLFLRSYAAEAASYVTEHDLLPGGEAPRLLTMVGDGVPDEAALREQLVALHRRLFGEILDADAEPIDETLALWNAAHARSGDPVVAWKTTLTAMLQDLRIIYY